MPRRIESFNPGLITYRTQPYVCTLTPQLTGTPEYLLRGRITRPNFSHALVSPGRVAELPDVRNLGQFRVKTSFTKTRGENVEVFADASREPVVFEIVHDLLPTSLYPSFDENPEPVLRRSIFFCRAALTLLREAHINPHILNCVDWPTAPAIAYLKKGSEFRLDPKILFTYLSAKYPGIFDNSLLHLTGITEENFVRNFLQYLGNTFSLAKLGLKLSDLVLTGSKEEVKLILEGRRPPEWGGVDWGGFPEIYKSLYHEGARDNRIRYMFATDKKFTEHMGPGIAPPTDADDIFNLAARQVGAISHLYQPPRIAEISKELLQRLIAEGTSIRFQSLANLQELLENEFFSDGEKAIIKSISIGFGSTNLIEYLYTSLARILEINLKTRETADPALETERSAIESSMRRLLKQLAELEIDWKNFRDISERVFFGDPMAFSSIKEVTSHSLADNRPDLIEKGLAFLSAGEQPYSPLMILTMSGGLGQRFGFSIALNHKSKTIKLPAQLLGPEINQWLEAEKVTSEIDKREDNVWNIPFDKLAEMRDRFASPFLQKLYSNLEQAVSQNDNFVYLPKGFFVMPGQPYSLFEQQARSIAKLESSSGKKMFWTIMTSDDNHDLVQRYFQSSLKGGKYFGLLDPAMVKFIPQGNNPVVTKDGKNIDIYIDKDKGEIVPAANGHGGFYEVARKALEEIKAAYGFEPQELLSINIENPLLNFQLGKLDFIAHWLGYKIANNDQVSGLATAKASPVEAMGILAKADNIESVVEYNVDIFSYTKAFAYESTLYKDEAIFFVRTDKGKVMIVREASIAKVFKSKFPPDRDNWTKAVGKWDEEKGKFTGPNNLRDGYTPIARLEDIRPDEPLFEVDGEGEVLNHTGRTFKLSDLHGLQLKYRQGNTNIFLISTLFIDLVNSNPQIALNEEYKSGKTPYGDEAKKIERMIFGALRNIIAYEYSKRILEELGGRVGISVVESPRGDCFEPLKDPPDVKKAREAYERLIEKYEIQG